MPLLYTHNLGLGGIYIGTYDYVPVPVWLIKVNEMMKKKWVDLRYVDYQVSYGHFQFCVWILCA